MTGLVPDLDFELLSDLEYHDAVATPGNASAISAPALRNICTMEHFAALAAESESEAEAEAFIGAIVPFLANMAPTIAKAVPAIVSGAAKVGRQLWRDPSTRQMVRSIPTIARRTAADLLGHYGGGKHVTLQDAGRAFSRHAAPVLRAPDAALRRNRILDRQYHQQVQQLARRRQAVVRRAAPAAARTNGVPGHGRGRCPCCGR